MVMPPLYGSFYRDNPLTITTTPVTVNPDAEQKDWYNQLNLNPAMRVAASQGSAVIQKDQETIWTVPGIN